MLAKHPLKPCYPLEDGPGLTVKCPPHTTPRQAAERHRPRLFNTRLLSPRCAQASATRPATEQQGRGQAGPWGVMSAPSCVEAGAVEAGWGTAQGRKPGTWQGSHGAGAGATRTRTTVTKEESQQTRTWHRNEASTPRTPS